ncbi:MAG: insulinase family protein [Acidobacteria bacterium]|nr:insulinase family protein [Acidobacteriota bacterium]
MLSENGTFAARTKRVQLPNGVTLLVYENHATPTVQITLALRAGHFLDPQDKRGLAQICAAMLRRGTQRCDKLEIAQRLEDVGAELDLYANRFLVRGHGQALSQDTSRLLSTLCEILREPSFPEHELEKLRQQVVGHLKRQQEQTAIRAFERFLQLIYEPKSPFYQPPVEEQIAAIESLTVEDIHQFYEQYYGAAALVLVIVGDVDSKAIEEQVADLFADWSPGEPAQISIERTRPHGVSRREFVPMVDKANADIVMGHAGQLRRTDPGYYAAYIANAALGHSTLSSRLGLRVRDQEGLTYGIASRFIEAGFGDGPWAVSLTVNPENVDQALDSTQDVIKSYVEEGITEKELEDEKSSFIGSFIVGLDTNAGLASHLLSAEVFGFGPKHLDELPSLVATVTQDQVNAAIQRYIQPRSFVTVIAGEYHPAES